MTISSTSSSTSTASSTASTGATAAAATTTAAQTAAANRAAAQQLINSLSAGSGVDVNALAQNLVNAEQVPQQNQINAKISASNSRISGYAALSYAASGINTAFTALKDQNSFNALTVASSNTGAFSITPSATASAGMHQVSVNQLAQAQRTVSAGYASASASLNNGNPMTLALTVGTTNPKTTNIELPAGRDTPQDIVNFVNAANTGVTAQLVNTGSGANPYQVVLTGATGAQNSFTLTTKYSMGGVQDATSSINSGSPMTLNLTVGGTLHTLSLPAGQDTPNDIVAAINNSGTGVTASVDASVSGSTFPYKIDLSGPSSDPSNFSLAIDYGSGSTPAVTPGLSFPANATGNQTANDAQLQVDGINYTRSSNSFNDVISGATMNLTTTTSTPATVQFSLDTSTIVTNINNLVQAYNDAHNIISAVTDPKSTLATYGATLVGDSTARMVESKLRSLFSGTSSTPGTNISSLWQIGISIDASGTMSVDSTKLNTALNSNYSDVVKMFTGNQNGLSIYSTAPAGIAGDAVKALTNLVGSTGPLVSQTDSANKLITGYQTDLTNLQTRMNQLLTRYQTQFAAMNSLVGTINAQKTSLKSSFDGMMAMYTNKN
jgi:flagellar hook-associated protein 2